ncbi:MAG: PilW family protein [Rhodocyclaceae bacterium]|nr:PilW family protein [Rhodocyclaceae bacterium]MCB1962190.1 PilW family protein [Rhodocyclaceae bacterium]
MTQPYNTLRASPIRQRGLSLIELMVGMLIGLLLIGGMISVFAANKQTYRYNEELARLQENSRFAVEFIQRSLRMAGHIGCPELNAPPTALQRASLVPALDLKTITAVTAYRYSTSNPGVLASMGMSAKSGTDVVTVTYGSGASATLDAVVQAGDDSLVIKNNALGFKQGEVALISNCEQAELFSISNTPASGNSVTLEHKAGGGNNPAGTHWAWAEDARIMRLNQQIFFIGPSTGRTTNRQGNAFNSLYVGTNEMVEGVDDMVITYGVPASAGGTEVSQYVDVTAVTDWSDVLAIKIELLMASVDDNAITENQTVTFNGTAATKTDHRMYSTAATTISLRGNVD